ncbi:MAG: HlyD family secretion protein [Rhizobiales bacterium 65-9]|nr:efflux RND transporter periplasmic adaptor subunit [Hyphomicrobiales bacterium]OJY37039.1 MAG: HlyD family secretion protein [Rhizobiales bacterium 65-9]
MPTTTSSKPFGRPLVSILAFSLLLTGCNPFTTGKKSEGNGAKVAQEDYERGPHRGRMLRSGNFAVEVTIFEDGVEPEFHVYAYRDDKPLDPKNVRLEMRLTRLGGRIDKFSFTPKDDFLRGEGVVHEPHSFDVAVIANSGDTQHEWTYASYEGRTTITAEAAEAAGIGAEAAGPAVIAETVDLPGRIMLLPQGRAEVRPWYAGRIVEMTKMIGQPVKQGDLLARIEASDSLRSYQITAPISGVIAERNANVGEVATQPLYVIVDTSKVYAAIHAFPRDGERIAIGQPIEVRGLGTSKAEARVSRIMPNADPATQTIAVEADIDNAQGLWRPGMAVEASIAVASRRVPLAVRTRGLQRFRDFTVVFAKVGDTYEVRMLKLGQRGKEWTEVLEGVAPNEVYVSDNSYLIRADIEKSGASHDH